MLGNLKNDMGHGPARSCMKRHTSFFGCAVAFFDITFASKLLPRYPRHRSPPRERGIMWSIVRSCLYRRSIGRCNCHGAGYCAVRTDLFVGNLDVRTQTDDRRQWRIGIDKLTIVLNLFSFTLHQKTTARRQVQILRGSYDALSTNTLDTEPH
jgi:hypothetical protein